MDASHRLGQPLDLRRIAQWREGIRDTMRAKAFAPQRVRRHSQRIARESVTDAVIILDQGYVDDFV